MDKESIKEFFEEYMVIWTYVLLYLGLYVTVVLGCLTAIHFSN